LAKFWSFREAAAEVSEQYQSFHLGMLQIAALDTELDAPPRVFGAQFTLFLE
jgi:hypothetical protein